MRKNVLNKILVVVISIITVIALIACFTACKETKISWIDVQNNMNNVKSMECKILMTDKNVSVMDYTKKVDIDGENASVTVIETKLGDDFLYQTDETSKNLENIDKTTLLPLNIDSAVLTTLAKSTSNGLNVYGGELEEVFVKQLMNSNGELNINGTATLNIKCNGNNVQEITLDYVTKTGRVVSVSYAYVY